MNDFPGIIRLTVDEYEECISNAVNEACDRLVNRVNDEAEKIRDNKEKLRLALIAAGYQIPEGLTIAAWIPYIEGRNKK